MVVEGRIFFTFCSCSWQVKDLGPCLWTGCPRSWWFVSYGLTWPTESPQK